ncbi:hypothetical protein BT93_F0093 [Corymbia citriodora subsp. variegata]|nr:hypothetical protein BT93_F0093 [Corymbia citriodora subsp. variegata]
MKGVHWLLMVAAAWWLRQGGARPVLGKCEHRCGDVDVPFPFGLNTCCVRSQDFLLNCTNIEGGGIQLRWGNLRIRRISVGDSTMVASLPEAYECYDQNGELVNHSSSPAIDLSPNPRYRFSETQNKLTVVGCDTLAVVADREGAFRGGCVSYCSGKVDFANKTICSGQGCCQASIPEGLQTLDVKITSIGPNLSAWQRGHCARAFVVADRSFNISDLTLPGFQDVVGNNSDLVLDWMVEPDVTCQDARSNPSYACGKNANCTEYGNGSGYRCICKPGYNGNPYSPFEDINECKDPETYPCDGKCENTPGSYTCKCGLRKKGNTSESCEVSPLSIAFPVLAVSFFSVTMTGSVSFTMRVRLKMINFRQNGGEFFLERKVQIFPELELAKATNNYDYRNKLGNGGFGSVHKGTLEKHRDTVVIRDTVVVVKKPIDVDKSLINKDFQRELEILMKSRCKNVVKLKGICLETKIPSLVYEYIPNGTLFQLLHQNELTISWEKRFKIATEAALALDYMHSNTPIFHGNIKSANILLDQNNSVKISDFGTSVLMSPKHRHIVATQKEDSSGYIDPEYLITRELKTESDVYSFGAVLVELLTRKKLYVTKSGKPINTIHCFISSVKGDTLSDVIDFEGTSEDEVGKVQSIAEIAVRCLDPSGANRPAMSEVAEQLVSINPSSKVEEENEDLEEENEDLGEEWDLEKVSCLEEATSSCLSCMGLD